MSLKILLADESPTIRKAFEIALKDYGVKVQSVHQGIDVKELCESFKPHICFLDVLIPKLNGYEVSTQLKAEPTLSKIPTVIMWSGFMELDENKFMTSGANGKIEKPFESAELRTLVQKLVPSLESNEIAKHIIPDTLPGDEIFGNPGQQVAQSAPTPSSLTPPPPTPGNPPALPLENPVDNLDLDSLDSEIDNFSVESLGSDHSTQENNDFAGLEDLDDFKVETLDDDSFPLEGENSSASGNSDDPDDIFASFDASKSSSVNNSSESDDIFGSLENEVSNDDSVEDIFGSHDAGNEPPPFPQEVKEAENLTELEPLKDELPPLSSVETDSINKINNQPLSADAGVINTNSDGVPQLSKEELKRLILAQSKDIIESVVWDVVPELARELIQKEITKLMSKAEADSLDGDLR